MLLVHQAGFVKIGEVVRYTLTYTPSNDRILPTPSHLHLRVKNSSAIPLRAAWVHGPYTLHVSAYPSTFNPHQKVENPKEYGVPEYEPMVKAGGSWATKLRVPDAIRETGADLGRRSSMQQGSGQKEHEKGSVTWIVEIASQILFSNSASVHFEVLVGRDERSLELGFAAVAGQGHGGPGHVKDLQTEKERKEARKRGHVQTAGVYSKAVKLVVEDTETLWDKPALPTWEDSEEKKPQKDTKEKKERKRRNVHLVILTHGLHSNLGADMLFMKESIDATVAQARLDAKKRKAAYKAKKAGKSEKPTAGQGAGQTDGEKKVDDQDTSTAQVSGGQEELDNAPEESDDEEETIVRGFSGNAVRTENGIQYLGKRLAKYILKFTYPDQPFLPVKKTFTRKVTETFTMSDSDKAKKDGKAVHQGSSIHTPKIQHIKPEDLPYIFTSISFVGHSLGGLIQTYAVAYIHKHSPTFFDQIKPVNFICLASPMLGLSNENPMYVKFALDFGLVGRTGQDLGLTWRPPTLATKGWNVMMNGFGAGTTEKDADGNKASDPSAKPLLRILPTGPAHQVLRRFRNRTVYSNVVNDGIVPLRTSCLLFLDWRGLGKVEKARRENGLIGTIADWGWAELTGANASSITPNIRSEAPWESEDESNTKVSQEQRDAVPLPGENETADDNKLSTNRLSYEDESVSQEGSSSTTVSRQNTSQSQDKGMLDTLLGFFRAPAATKTPAPSSKKTKKAISRAQTIYRDEASSSDEMGSKDQEAGTTTNPTMRPQMPHLHSSHKKRPLATRGSSTNTAHSGEVQAPPKTSIFESAGDILHPPMPSRQWITDPAARARTIFHDRVYHPEDIPPPPIKRGSESRQNLSSRSSTTSLRSQETAPSTSQSSSTSASQGTMKVEEKIARAYHRDLSWRKVLVRLEPDAHNNIIVRRMFANAYGWPVVKHLCDTHFADTHSARTRDEEEPARERAKPMDQPIDPKRGEHVQDQTAKKGEPKPRTKSETREARDELVDLEVPQEGVERSASSRGVGPARRDSELWDDSFFEETDDGEDSDTVDERNLVSRILNPNYAIAKKQKTEDRQEKKATGSSARPETPQKVYTDGHRGLAPTSPSDPPRSPREKERRSRQSQSQAESTKPTFSTADLEAPAPAVLTDHQGLVQEPDSMGNSPTSPTAVQDGSLPGFMTEGGPVSPGSTAADVGLRKTVEEQFGESRK
ncbi:unnamed protein product [Zymoseptoria tritici ST99CH_3D7]|uniref:DUF676 domain-containing protein n=1 Tax=Zymoseptoria tritici (strain ST99CH_3D7) TaxID=1276538 RepID=A0A1X7RII1_ZYMT9|nr:unnamed protein product [Zymoseptoria tritici ST99CH_3D7]